MGTNNEGNPGWLMSPTRASLPVNSELLRDLRKARGFTQERLAELSGYSSRLIRKAEAGQPVHADTIEVLAEALSTTEAPISPETLVSDLEALVRAFAVSYAQDERKMVSKVGSIFAPNVVYKMAGDPQQIPFAGEYHGIDGVDRWARTLFSVFNRPHKDLYQPVLYRDGAAIVAVGHDAAQIHGIAEIIHSITVVRFEFERGKIVLADNDYDTHGSIAYFQRHREKLIEDEGLPEPN